MAVVYENDCCMCAVSGYPCTGEHKRVPHFYCDKCKKEFDESELYVTDDGELCSNCILGEFETVEQANERSKQ